jgi:hypothetical protein
MRSKILLGALVVVTHGLFYHQAGWNQNARLDGVFAFVEPGTPSFRTLRIDQLVNGAGDRGTGTGDWAESRGHYYSNKPPGSTFLGIVAYLPLQALEHRLGVAWRGAVWTNLNSYLINLFVSVFFSALGVVLLFDTLTRRFAMTAIDALLICAAYGWGTLIFSFDATLWGHPTAAAFVMVGLHGLFRESRAGALQAGFGMGMAVLVDNVSGIALGATGIYLIASTTRRRSIGWFVLSAMLPLGVLLVYQRVIFGGFLTPPTFRSSAQFQAADRLGGVFGGISLSVLAKLTFSAYRGAFLFMPVLAFCLPGGRRRFGSDRAVFALCSAAILGTLLLISSFNGWHGGYSAGPRYLIPVLPFFALLLPAFSTLGRPAKVVYIALLMLSIANAMVFCATTTIVPEGDMNPLYGDAYGRAWRDPWSLAPVFGRTPFARRTTFALATGVALLIAARLIAYGRAKPVPRSLDTP